MERQDGNAIPDELNRVITTDVSNDMSRLTFRDLREEDTANYSVQVAVPGVVERQPIFLTVLRGEFTSMFVHCIDVFILYSVFLSMVILHHTVIAKRQ